MNRRQAKKKYKKVYGHNPPTVRKQLYELQRTFYEAAEAITSINKSLYNFLDTTTQYILKMKAQHQAEAGPDVQVEVAMMLSKKRKDGKRRKRR